MVNCFYFDAEMILTVYSFTLAQKASAQARPHFCARDR